MTITRDYNNFDKERLFRQPTNSIITLGVFVDLIRGNSKVLRNINRSMILNIIRNAQPISRAKIATITGLNKSTVSSIVTELLDKEVIYEELFNDSNIGRNPLNLYLKLGKFLVGAINIDSSMARFAICDIDGSVLVNSSIPTELNNPDEFMIKCLSEINKLRVQYGIEKLEGLGVSIAGIVDSKKLIVEFAPNLGWENFHIGDLIKNEMPDLNILAVENDAKASALAELWFGNHSQNFSNFVFLSVGTGIGCGIVVENEILDGEFHASGEFGHMVIYEEGELCVCGNRGCWEMYASDRALVKRFVRKKKIKTGQDIDVMIDDIIELAKESDVDAKEELKRTGNYIGLGIVNIIKTIDPHAIIIGGRITQAWDIIYPEIMEVIRQRSFFGKRKDILLIPTTLPVRPRLLGAATIAIKHNFDDYRIMI